MSLYDIQQKVHVAKDKKNDFGGYNYRTAEGILAAIKVALPEGASIIVSDSIQEVAGQIFVSSTATIHMADGVIYSATGHAMHPLQKKGMDPSQITGAATSYARKYALGGLVALDDGSVDPDATNKHNDKEDTPEPEPFDAAGTRDRIKAALEGAPTVQKLNAIWKHKATAEAFEKLHPAMQAELTKVHSNRMAAVSQAPDDEAA